MSPVSPRAELVLAWAVEAVIKSLSLAESDEAIHRVAAGDIEAVGEARRLALGHIDPEDEREREVDDMLFGADARLDEVEEGRSRVDALLSRVESQLAEPRSGDGP